MGTFKVTAEDLARSMALDLNQKEDFDKDTLHKALKILKNYPYVSDEDNKEKEYKWKEFMEE